ncbi:hypothetical protein [Halomicrobium sp. LC1Hm]|uniref:hypothetical protein n=1 Tax=Halomicrobium sp. LC1Hm TaxID=2610902 RepID=UPI00129854F5|nr:hypothetical protein [Halomicrobium sp. LC1Hm]
MSENDNPAVDAHRDEIDAAVNDGGGCVEAWSSLNDLREDGPTNVDRRAAIKIVGGSVGALVGVGSASADEPASPSEVSVDPEVVSGADERRAVSAALTSRVYQQLSDRVRAEQSLFPDTDDTTVVRVEDQDGTAHEIVGIALRPTTDESDNRSSGETGHDSIAVVLKAGTVVSGRAIVTERAEGHEGVDGLTAAEAEAVDFTVSSTTYYTDDGEVRSGSASAAVAVEPGSGNGSVPSPEGISTAESNICWACTTIGNSVCALGCSVGAALICAAAGLAGGAPGIACGAIVGTLCGILSAAEDRFVGAGCGADYGIEAACYYGDYCEDNPLETHST